MSEFRQGRRHKPGPVAASLHDWLFSRHRANTREQPITNLTESHLVATPWVVLDTNVVLDMWLFDDPHARPLRQALEGGKLRCARLQVMMDELADVLTRPFVARAPVDGDSVLKQALLVSLPAPVTLTGRGPLRCSDDDDQVFIDLALALPARWLFSRDRALLALAPQASARGLTIVRPCDWPGQVQAPAA